MGQRRNQSEIKKKNWKQLKTEKLENKQNWKKETNEKIEKNITHTECSKSNSNQESYGDKCIHLKKKTQKKLTSYL